MENDFTQRPSPSVQSAVEWAAEQMETAEYVTMLRRSLKNGDTITESLVGETPMYIDDAQRDNLSKEKSRQKQQWEQHKKHAKLARYSAWEGDMLSSRGHWTQHTTPLDKENLLLIRQSTNLYIRVQDRNVDAGIYQGVKFESFWGKRFPSFDNARNFVLQRAMGKNQEHKKT